MLTLGIHVVKSIFRLLRIIGEHEPSLTSGEHQGMVVMNNSKNKGFLIFKIIHGGFRISPLNYVLMNPDP